MNKKNFDQLIQGVNEMKVHMAGQHVDGVRLTELHKNQAAASIKPFSDQLAEVQKDLHE
jgi:hypothetical protein